MTLSELVNYWYFRYLLVTELYMVEKWERAMIHIVLFIILSFISLFNTTVVLGLVTVMANYLSLGESMGSTTFQEPNPVIHSEF